MKNRWLLASRSCLLSLVGIPPGIRSLLRAFCEGFHSWKHLMRDDAFAQLRQTTEFARLTISPGPDPGAA